jgi:hypothetical protein
MTRPAPPSRLVRREWRDLLSTIRRDLERMRAENRTGSTDTKLRPTLTPTPRVEGPGRISRRSARSPAQDEWASIKRGFAALAKANGITEAKRPLAKRPA